MWIYYKDQCNYCKNNQNCEYIDKAKDFMNKLEYLDKVSGVYGTISWSCDYHVFDADKYIEENLNESNTATS